MISINTYIEKIEKRKLHNIEDTILKLNTKKEISDKWYTDTKLIRFRKQSEQLEKDITELNHYKDCTSAKDLSSSDYEQLLMYKEAIKVIKDTLDADGYSNKSLLKYIDKLGN